MPLVKSRAIDDVPALAFTFWSDKMGDYQIRQVAEVVGNEFRFMKAIPTGAVCLKCHGTDLSPAVTAKLTELYPDDKATGFKEGDLRGAFVVVKNLTQ